jgi:hypothetical protein
MTSRLWTAVRALALYRVAAAYLLITNLLLLVLTRRLQVGFGLLAVGLVFVAVMQVELYRQNSEAVELQDELNREIGEVHQLVNSQHTWLVGRINQLVTALNQAGASVPEARDL